MGRNFQATWDKEYSEKCSIKRKTKEKETKKEYRNAS
jgi:hypothetical protein